MDPGRGHDWGLLHSTFNNRLHDDNEEAHAFGVDDVEQIIPASVQINTLLDDRRHKNSGFKQVLQRSARIFRLEGNSINRSYGNQAVLWAYECWFR